ncbi:MAG: Periplasmic copper-binding protein (NosD) [Euryarchaeota archaeon ADurb.Bin294]|nr:MAG: Periplasmic copper-binding protein (NosD) [Euryarchaeota archaeon ADurb.Bin294]
MDIIQNTYNLKRLFKIKFVIIFTIFLLYISGFSFGDDTFDENILITYPVTLEKPGVYYLNESVFINDSAIHITHSDIILDGRGNIVTGNMSSGSIGITIQHPEMMMHNITIRNITIRDFETGILIDNSHEINLEETDLISHMRTGIRIETSEDIQITRCTVQNNRNEITGGYGIQISDSNKVKITNSQVTGNGKTGKSNSGGIYITNSSETSIISSQISTNPGFGIRADNGTEHLKISDCDISVNSGDGILIQSGSSPDIQKSILDKNKESGIELIKVVQPVITGNVITSGTMGISLSDTEDMTLTGNSLKNNRIGFDISASDIRYYNHHISNTNTIDSRTLIYLKDVRDRKIGPSMNPSMVIIVNSSDIALSELVLSKNCAGIILANSSNLTLTDISFIENGIGIRSEFGTNNLICNNLHAERNLVSGYYISNTNNFTLTSIYGQESPSGIYLHNATGAILKYIYMTQITGLKSRMPSGITLSGCDNISVSKSQFSECSYAGLLSDSDHLNLTDNRFLSNTYAGSVILSGPVDLYNNSFLNNEDTGLILRANQSTILRNTFTNNKNRGILLISGNENLFAYNTFKNYKNCMIQDKNAINIWNTSNMYFSDNTYPAGNYWGDPEGEGFSDICTTDPNGCCIDPYIIQLYNIDYHPLSSQYIIESTMNTDLNQNGREDLQDVVLYMNKVSSGDTSSLYDFSGDGKINLNDVVSLFHIIIKK